MARPLVRFALAIASLLTLGSACGRSSSSSSGSQRSSPQRAATSASTADAEQRIVQAVAEGRDVTVTVHIEVPPEKGARDRRARVTGVQFGPDGAVQTFYLVYGPTKLTFPAAGFRKVLVAASPITIGSAKKG